MRLLTGLLVVVSCFGQARSRSLLAALTDAPNAPTDSPGAGTYSSTQSVTLSDATAQFINYTTDGSTPACPATGTLYSSAISVAATTTIKAIGCNGVTGGSVLTSVYTITAAGPTLVQFSSYSSFGSPWNVTMGSNITSGNELWGMIISNGTGHTFTTPTSCSSGTATVGTWTPITMTVSGGASGKFYKAAVTGSGSCTVSFIPNGADAWGYGVWEFSGGTAATDATVPLVNANASFCTTCSGGNVLSITPTSDNGVCLYFYHSPNSDTVSAVGGGFTLNSQNAGSSYTTAGMYKIETTAAACSPSFTQSGSNTFNEGLGIAH